MLDIKFVRENPDLVDKILRSGKQPIGIAKFFELDENAEA